MFGKSTKVHRYIGTNCTTQEKVEWIFYYKPEVY